jgi:hypothetical protein
MAVPHPSRCRAHPLTPGAACRNSRTAPTTVAIVAMHSGERYADLGGCWPGVWRRRAMVARRSLPGVGPPAFLARAGAGSILGSYGQPTTVSQARQSAVYLTALVAEASIKGTATALLVPAASCGRPCSAAAPQGGGGAGCPPFGVAAWAGVAGRAACARRSAARVRSPCPTGPHGDDPPQRQSTSNLNVFPDAIAAAVAPAAERKPPCVSEKP